MEMEWREDYEEGNDPSAQQADRRCGSHGGNRAVPPGHPADSPDHHHHRLPHLLLLLPPQMGCHPHLLSRSHSPLIRTRINGKQIKKKNKTKQNKPTCRIVCGGTKKKENGGKTILHRKRKNKIKIKRLGTTSKRNPRKAMLHSSCYRIGRKMKRRKTVKQSEEKINVLSDELGRSNGGPMMMGYKDNRNHLHGMVDKVLNLIPRLASPPPPLSLSLMLSFPLSSCMARSNFPLSDSNISHFPSFYSSKLHLSTLDPINFPVSFVFSPP